MSHIHGHEVMHMMANSGLSYTRESLREAIHTQFGAATTYFTCSSDRMNADQLMDFLQSKGKFHPTEGGFGLDKDQICNH